MADNTGPCDPYDGYDEGVIEAALDRAFQQWEAGSGDDEPPAADYETGGGGRTPTRMTVTARIEWAGVHDRANGGVRRTQLDDLRLAPVKEALDRARSAEARAADARPASSYRAKSWHAQLRELTGHGRGSAAADKAGLDPSARTLTEWLAERRAPSPENRAKIAEAYEALRTWKLDAARADAAQARHDLATRLSDALGNRYGADIRLRDITSLRLED